MNLINAISNLNLRCSKVPIKSSCPGCPCTFSVRFWTATWNPTNYEKPFFSPHFPSFLPLKPTRLELNVQTWWSQSFTILCIEASSLLPRSFSFSGRRRWTSCSLESGGGGVVVSGLLCLDGSITLMHMHCGGRGGKRQRATQTFVDLV